MIAKRRKKLQALAGDAAGAEGLRPARRATSCWSAGVRRKARFAKPWTAPAPPATAFPSLHIKHLNPLPNGLENIFSGFHHVFVVEMNDEGLYGYGQLGGMLRARYCDPQIRGINKTDGLTWKVKEILDRVKTQVVLERRDRQNRLTF